MAEKKKQQLVLKIINRCRKVVGDTAGQTAPLLPSPRLTLASWRLVQSGSEREGQCPAPASGSPGDTHKHRQHSRTLLSSYKLSKPAEKQELIAEYKVRSHFTGAGGYLLSHGHAPWGDDDIGAIDSLVESWQQVVRAENTNTVQVTESSKQPPVNSCLLWISVIQSEETILVMSQWHHRILKTTKQPWELVELWKVQELTRYCRWKLANSKIWHK